MAPSPIRTNTIGYHLLPPDSKDSQSGFSFTALTVNASDPNLVQLDQTQAGRICRISKGVLCNICTASTAAVFIVSGVILATIYHQEIPAVVVTITGLALCYFPICRLLVTDY